MSTLRRGCNAENEQESSQYDWEKYGERMREWRKTEKNMYKWINAGELQNRRAHHTKQFWLSTPNKRETLKTHLPTIINAKTIRKTFGWMNTRYKIKYMEVFSIWYQFHLNYFIYMYLKHLRLYLYFQYIQIMCFGAARGIIVHIVVPRNHINFWRTEETKWTFSACVPSHIINTIAYKK